MYLKSKQATVAPEALLHDLIGGAMVTQMLAQVARLGIADHLSAEPLSARDLATRVDAHPEALYRVLRALSSHGVFVEDEEKRFSLTAVGNLLKEDAGGSLRTWAMMNGSPWYWEAMGHSAYSVSTGMPSFEDRFGMTTFQYFQEEPEAGELLHETARRFNQQLLPHLLKSYDFSSYRHLIDVGGGHGEFLSALMESYPEVGGTLFELPFVIESVQAQRGKNGSQSFELCAGDFFESVPRCGDGYLLKHVIHDWNDLQALRILRNCCDAMDNNARLMVIENVVRPRNEACPGKMLDLTMMLLDGGRERTAEEFANLFSAAGLRLSRIVPVSDSLCVVEGVRGIEPR